MDPKVPHGTGGPDQALGGGEAGQSVRPERRSTTTTKQGFDGIATKWQIPGDWVKQGISPKNPAPWDKRPQNVGEWIWGPDSVWAISGEASPSQQPPGPQLQIAAPVQAQGWEISAGIDEDQFPEVDVEFPIGKRAIQNRALATTNEASTKRTDDFTKKLFITPLSIP